MSPPPVVLLERLLALHPGASHRTLKEWVAQRRVLVNGEPARALKQPVEEGDRVEVAPRAAAGVSLLAPLERVHEDADVLVVAKPPDLLTATNPGERRKTALALVAAYLARTAPRAKAGLVHRLDQDASGLLVFAKTPRALRSLKQQFFEHTVSRRYAAVVHGVPSPREGRIESELVERADGSVREARPGERGKHAITEYVVERAGSDRALLRLTLHTGRKHQIRAHLAARGHPLVGDPIYRSWPPSDRPLPRRGSGRLLLCAVALGFDSPADGSRLELALPVPEEFAAAL